MGAPDGSYGMAPMTPRDDDTPAPAPPPSLPPRPWPSIRPDDPSAIAAWRATVQERLDAIREDQAVFSARLVDIHDAVRGPRKGRERCVAAGIRLAERLVEGVVDPSRGTIVLAVLASLVALAAIGWSATDVADLRAVVGLPAAEGAEPPAADTAAALETPWTTPPGGP